MKQLSVSVLDRMSLYVVCRSFIRAGLKKLWHVMIHSFSEDPLDSCVSLKATDLQVTFLSHMIFFIEEVEERVAADADCVYMM